MKDLSWSIDDHYPELGRESHMKGVIVILFFLWALLIPFFCSYGGEHIVLYQVGEKDPAVATMLKKLLAGKGYGMSVLEGTDSIEKHVELANKINKLRASLFLALNFSFSEQENVLVAITDAKKKTGQILAVEDVPAIHAADSREYAVIVADLFNKKVIELPLFPLLGIDMPGVLLRVECQKEKVNEVLGKISDSIQKYFGRGMKK
ncbi:MAG: hypothetical protein C0392_12320 [Syntrophus sp. (in: bacteria)]|nr:hypothetical protein [Syntrophus sp. (in: bacteria)]